MFGKRRKKDGEDGLEQFDGPDSDTPASSGPESPKPASGGIFGGSMSGPAPGQTTSRPLYGGEAEAAGSAQPTEDSQFSENLEADLARADNADDMPDPEAVEAQLEASVAIDEPTNDSANEAPTQPVTETATPGAVERAKAMRGISKDGDQMLGLLSTIESQLGELQRLKADRESLIDDLEHAQQEVESQKALLDEREQAVQALEEEAKENQRITEGMLAEAQEKEKHLAEARASFDADRERVEAMERSLDERSVDLESRDAELRRRLEDLESRERESEQRENELRERITSEFEARVNELNQTLESLRGEVESLRRQIDERNAELERVRAEADERVRAREEELRNEFEQRVEGAKQSGDERVRALERELDEARNALQEASGQREQGDRERQELESKVGELNQQLEAMRHEAEEAKRRAEEASSESGDVASAAAESDERAKQLEAELSKTREQLAEAGRHLSEAQERSREQGERVETLSAELEQVRAKASESPEPAPGIDPAEITKRDRVIELLKNKLDAASAQCRQLQEQAGASGAGSGDAQQKAALDALQQKLLAKQQELDVAAHKLAAREKALEGKGGAKPMSPMGGGGTEEEREALRKESEKLYAQREQLAETKAALDRKAAKVAARASKGKAVNLMMSAVVTMAILAALSWYVVGQVVQPVHVASVELGIDPQATGLSERQREAWQDYHEALLDDPQFHELAARRLKQRGYSQFGSPSDVRAMVTDGLITMESGSDGRLTLLYAAPGAERTERVLDTFSGSLSGFANETRDHRFDGAATAIITPVASDPTPIEDPRLNMFAMVFGGACAFALFGSVVMWRRMARDLTQFEDRLADGLELSAAEIGPTEGGASTEGKRLMF